MGTNIRKQISDRYCPRFGQLAVEMGFITDAQLKQALCRQVDENLAGEQHRLLGTILLDMDLMTGDQIEKVLNELFENSSEAQPVK